MLLQWWFSASVVVLAINDHVLKDAFPGWWTGKLSDVVGPVVVATLLAVVVGRTPAVAITAAAFVALKTVPGVAEVAAPLLGGVTRRDPTDLLGLVALVPIWRAMGPDATTPSGCTRVTADRRLAVVSAGMALLVATATSYDHPPGVGNLQVEDGVVHAKVSDSYLAEWARSSDGGRTWVPGKGPRPVEVDEHGNSTRVREVCGDVRCVRIEGLTVEERATAGQWTRVFAYSDDDLELMDYRARTEPHLSDVVVVDMPEGDAFVVSTGQDGVLVSGPDGEWERADVLDVESTDLSGTMLFFNLLPWAYLASFAVLLYVVLDTVARSSGSSRKVSAYAYFVAVIFWLLGVGASFVVLGYGALGGADPVVLAAVVYAILAAAVLLPWAYLSSGRRAGRWNITP